MKLISDGGTANDPPSDSLLHPLVSNFDDGIDLAVPPSETADLLVQNSVPPSSTTKIVNIQPIRELSKRIYNTSFLLSINSNDDVDNLVEKLNEVHTLMSNFIKSSNNLTILPQAIKKVSDLPRQKKRKKKEESSGNKDAVNHNNNIITDDDDNLNIVNENMEMYVENTVVLEL